MLMLMLQADGSIYDVLVAIAILVSHSYYTPLVKILTNSDMILVTMVMIMLMMLMQVFLGLGLLAVVGKGYFRSKRRIEQLMPRMARPQVRHNITVLT